VEEEALEEEEQEEEVEKEVKVEGFRDIAGLKLKHGRLIAREHNITIRDGP